MQELERKETELINSKAKLAKLEANISGHKKDIEKCSKAIHVMRDKAHKRWEKKLAEKRHPYEAFCRWYHANEVELAMKLAQKTTRIGFYNQLGCLFFLLDSALLTCETVEFTESIAECTSFHPKKLFVAAFEELKKEVYKKNSNEDYIFFAEHCNAFIALI